MACKKITLGLGMNFEPNPKHPRGNLLCPQTMLVFRHIVGMLNKDVAFSYNPLLYSRLSSHKALIQGCKI